MLNLEHEAKSLISREEFNYLIERYKLNQPIIQTNIYLETNNMYYKKQGGALRIRSYDDLKYELTLKIKNDRSNEEYNYPISELEYNIIKDSLELPDYDYPMVMFKPENKYQTITKRYKLAYDNYMIEIDETDFDGVIDYEIEIEAESIAKADALMTKFLKEENINYKQSMPKIARYFKYHQK